MIRISEAFPEIRKYIVIFWYIYCGCLVAKSCLTLVTPGTVAHQASLSMGFPRQEYWSGLPFPPPRDLPNPGSNLHLQCLLYFKQILHHGVTREMPHTHTHTHTHTLIYIYIWRRKWQPTPVFLPGEAHEQGSLVGYCSWGHKESDTTEQLSTYIYLTQGNPSYI